ncbi:hypothetical protein RRG08_011922 [Elysia crispata]|uniref:Uncharacterized protein n=1 Tax=Elysia crispata TaxID=231223 RepID=A0AAE0Y7Y0_9GAST|nr:hypothetical protein RRG08_011922 [Elysia crispata]
MGSSPKPPQYRAPITSTRLKPPTTGHGSQEHRALVWFYLGFLPPQVYTRLSLSSLSVRVVDSVRLDENYCSWHVQRESSLV